MANQATLVYTVKTVLRTTGATQGLLAGVILQTDDYPALLGAKVVSDTTAIVDATTVTRTLVFDLLPHTVPIGPFNPFANLLLPSPFRGSIVSSNPADTMRLRIVFKDVPAPSSPHSFSEDVVLTGTTPVKLIEPNKVRISSIAPTSGNAAPAGLVTLFSDPHAGLFGNGNEVFSILNNFAGSVFSDSPLDTAGGLGAHTLHISYQDVGLTGPFTVDVPLSGKTPVPTGVANMCTILNLSITAAGAYLGNMGTITLTTGPNGTGGLRGKLAPSFYAAYPPGSDQKAPFRDLFTHALASALSCKVAADDPVIS